jgi:hypothetical protein
MNIQTADLSQGRRFTVQVEAFKPHRSNSLHGFVDVTIPELKLKIRELTVHESHGKRWVGLPGKPMVNSRDCEVLADDRGKPRYVPVRQFIDRRIGDAFGDRVIEALLARWPDAFAERSGEA